MAEQGKWTEVLEYARDTGNIRIDSRSVRAGDIFVALPGSRVDGAKFVPQALENRAAFAVLGRGYQKEINDPRIVEVKDPREALGDLARAAFRTHELEMKIVGVTGTNGKTSCTYLLEHLLLARGYRVGVIGTVEYRWPGIIRTASMTTPDCLQTHSILREMAESKVDAVVMEVSSHALDQNRLAGIDFDVAVFTNLTQDHLDYHQDMESYFQAKKRLFSPVQGKTPRAVINIDDAYGRRLAEGLENPLTYAFNPDFNPDLRGEVSSIRPDGMEVKCFYKRYFWEVKSPLVGRYNASNMLGVVGTGLSLGLGHEDFSVFKDFAGVPGRLQKIPNDLGINMFVDYAHTPDALKNCCRALTQAEFTALVVVFGCGGNRDREKRPLMGEVACAYADSVVVTSDNPRDEEPQAIIEDILAGTGKCSRIRVEPDRREAIRLGASMCPEGGALLVAGKGHETYQEVLGQRRDFDDAKVLFEVGHAI